MERTFAKTGFTLIELIVSIVLVSIVILGIFAINNVLSNNNQDYGQRYLVKSQTQATLNHILNNVSLAVGSSIADNFGNPDIGILYGPSLQAIDSLCIHQDPNQTPGNYSDDIWLCYTWYPPADPTYPNQIVYCTFGYTPAAGNPSTRGAGRCTADKNPTFLGTAYGTPANNLINTITFNNNNVFTITINNCLNDSAASCFNADPKKQDPANNPQVTVTGSASPAQESQ